MLPRWHVILGIIFSIFLYYLFPGIGALNAVLVFLASVLIDFDHYMTAVQSKKSFSLFDAFDYYKELEVIANKDIKKGIRKKYDFHVFHTLEFHILVLLLGFFWQGFFFIFIGMLFHSLIDIISMSNAGVLYMREFFFFNWMIKIKRRKR